MMAEPALTHPPDPAAGTARADTRQLGVLLGGFAVWYASRTITRAAQIQLLLAHFGGDTVLLANLLAQAVRQAR